MAVLSTSNLIHSQRIDVADLKAIDSFVAADFRALMKFLCGASPYIVDGCKVVNIIGNRAFISVANLFVFMPNSDTGSFYKESADSPDVEIELPANAQRVYVEMKINRTTSTPVTKGFWDPLAVSDNDNGAEYLAEADMEKNLVSEITYNLTGFTEGCLPIATFTVVAGNVTKVVDNRNMFFQSGNGGSHPNKKYTSPFSPNRSDSPVTGTTFGDNIGSPFRDTDSFGSLNPASFSSMKDWINGIAMVLSEIQGSPVWYVTSGANQIVRDLSLKTLFKNSTSGHSIDPSDDCWFTWNRDSNNLQDNKLRTGGTESLLFRHNYDRLSWTVSGSYSSGRIIDDVNFESPEIPDGANLYLKLQQDVLLNNKSVQWAPLDGSGLIDSDKTVAGIVNDFSGIAIGDFIRKESNQNKWYKVEGYVSGGTLFEPAEGTLVADNSTELKVDQSIEFYSDEPLLFFRTRYSNDDFVVESNTLEERLTGEFQSTQYYWLGRRVGDNFVFRNYGILASGEDTNAMDGQSKNAERLQNLVTIIYKDARFQSVGGVPQIRYFDGSTYSDSDTVLIEIRKLIKENWNANDSGNNRSTAKFTLAASTGHGLLFSNDGDELWATLSEDIGTHVLTAGDLSSVNEYQVIAQNNTPIASYENRDKTFIAKRQDINSVPYLVFADGKMLAMNGEHFIDQVSFDANVTHSAGRAVNSKIVVDDYQVLLTDELVMVEKPDTNLITITLPDSTNEELRVGSIFEIKDANLMCSVESFILIDCSGTDTIDDESGYTIESESEAVKVVYTGNGKWRII